MSRKLIAIFTALLLAASLCACGDKGGKGEETTDNNKIEIPSGEDTTAEDTTAEDTTAEGTKDNDDTNNSTDTEIGNPGKYEYVDCDEAVYVNNPGSAVTLRSAEYEAKGSVSHGTELKRIGLSTDEANYWSKIVYEGETYYVASKYLTDISNPDEGFVAVDKIVVVNDLTGSLNIRNLPTFNGSQIIGWAQAGEETKVIAENTETGWYKVEFVAYGGEIMTGYIKSGADNFVAETETTGNEDTTAGEILTETPGEE
ncbi:MAG: SH3 domain-containing protein [Ruminococcaceae bacterium]|nr:SH3 domain-containing protein [Oscillospiraceae bacterium]